MWKVSRRPFGPIFVKIKNYIYFNQLTYVEEERERERDFNLIKLIDHAQ